MKLTTSTLALFKISPMPFNGLSTDRAEKDLTLDGAKKIYRSGDGADEKQERARWSRRRGRGRQSYRRHHHFSNHSLGCRHRTGSGATTKASNTGEAENGVVRNAKDVKYGSAYTNVSSVMRVTIKRAQVPGAN
jgi:hypothetical protein